MPVITSEFTKKVRAQHIEFSQMVSLYRKDLYRFCRYLTNSPWDAEDLAQETLLKVYGRMGDTWQGVDDPKSYLFRVANNQWIDWCRRANRVVSEVTGVEPSNERVPVEFEIRDAMVAMSRSLPPRERVAFLLTEVFEKSLKEIADITGTTEGAVKAALHRAREKVDQGLPSRSLGIEPNVLHKELVDSFVTAFSKRDIDEVCKLFLSTASSNCYGCFSEHNLEQIRKGSLFYTMNTPDGKPQASNYEVRSVIIGGEPILVHVVDGKMTDVWKFQFNEGRISHFECYYCSPNVIEEIAGILKLEPKTQGYYFEETDGNS